MKQCLPLPRRAGFCNNRASHQTGGFSRFCRRPSLQTAPPLCTGTAKCPNKGSSLDIRASSAAIRDWHFVCGCGINGRMPRETIDQLARKLAEAVPEGLRSVRDDLEQNFRSVLHSGLSRLDLVTREEFDVQQAVLARTREKLEALERRLGTLEAGAATGGTAGTAGTAADNESSSPA